MSNVSGVHPDIHHTPNKQNEIAHIHYDSADIAAARSARGGAAGPELPISGPGFADVMEGVGCRVRGPLTDLSWEGYEGSFDCHITIGEDGQVSRLTIDLEDMTLNDQPLTQEQQDALLERIGEVVLSKLATLRFEPGTIQRAVLPFHISEPVIG